MREGGAGEGGWRGEGGKGLGIGEKGEGREGFEWAIEDEGSEVMVGGG